MIILGLNLFHEDTSAAIFKDNKLLSAFEEERLNKKKHTNLFPLNSINYCLEDNNIKIDEIDFIAVNYNKNYNFFSKINFAVRNIFNVNFLPKITELNNKRNVKKYLEDNLNHKIKSNIIYVPHHYAHNMSSYYFSGFRNALSISVDATGDFSTLECYFFNNLEVKLVYKKNFPDSLGFFYQALTQYLGFLEFGDEYKVMGLAAYGKPKYVDKLKKIINYDEKGNFKLNLKFFNFQRNIFNKEVEKVYFSSALEELIGRSRINNSIMTNYYADIAASVQFIFEDVLLKLLNSLYLKYNTNNLCLSGGCIQNSSFNGKIIKKTNFKNIYTTCSPGDSGGAIGAAASILFKNQILLDKKNYNNFLGRHYDNQYIMDNILEKTNSDFINYSRLQFPYLCKLIATKISKGKLIAWFQDKMEFGPRALGNRSILADPRNPNIKDLVNIKIKKREEFRPFAPSVLKEYASSFFNMDGIEEIPFMNIVVKVKEEKKNLIPGVVHFDETCRVHTVSKELNKKFHSLISEFYKITSIPLLLNTSLNIQGPIVESPIDAYNLFKNSDIDILVIEDFYFEKIKNVQKNT